MSDRERLSICYAVPGHDLLPSAGPTRNVLYLAEALSQSAHVTVAFRRILEPIGPTGYQVVEIDPGAAPGPLKVDDAALRGLNLHGFAAYLRALRRFVEARGDTYDIVLEKSWLLSGYLASLCQRHALPAGVVENIVRVWNEPVRHPRDWPHYTRYWIAQKLVGHYLRRAPLIIAETEELKEALTQRWQIPTPRIEVIGLGVDHHLFRPLDQAGARRMFGISPTATVLLYVGVLDKTHNLTPVLEAMRGVANSSLELHIVGDGVLRRLYEEKAQASRGQVFFHGRAPHAVIPQYIAAADVCLAPYDPTCFPNGQIAYATLKVPEYMACARPVVSVASGQILRLIQPGINGFLFPNHVAPWMGFLRTLPSRERLQELGMAAARVASHYSWQKTATAYFEVCEELITRSQRMHRLKNVPNRRDSRASRPTAHPTSE